MKVTEHLERNDKPLFSFEIIPPARGSSGQYIIEIVEQLKQFNPPFIDVTSHSAEAYYEEMPDGSIKRRIKRKRPGTIGICGVIQNRFNIDTVAHILVNGFSREETEDALIELNFLGIHNVLALRGDETNYAKPLNNNKSSNTYAIDLVRQINDLKKGIYLDEIINSSPLNFCIGVAGYPEKHFEAPNMKTDIHYLKQKIDAGAEFITTQMFFDNQKFFEFTDLCREEGITVPIIPGIKILNHKRHLKSIPKNFHVNLPDALVDEVMKNPELAGEIGIEWAIQQCQELLDHGINCIHFYVMNDTASAIKVIEHLKY
ncbi:MAG TPA: methylenetetrahydrofolate reductase [NAD(P)H] [Bacteroidia bacterium]|nr:methylenetetrahydrofolate reductase [NAD(P)H] [Sphingobacteriales bacterium]HPD65126.1 methylenetetrahydrofolate reductase [NAD(P)H] [Bacteroidia bacterium]HRS58713.1 methylenetetrahydrofolate reductase [NAD(P)H] [Bacteroidia bacterium]HRU68364.1 methylenetetrahydrofolate reductase [NAD(P)H] [Bacteroidia bacterium]